jgi:hypothetical protein
MSWKLDVAITPQLPHCKCTAKLLIVLGRLVMAGIALHAGIASAQPVQLTRGAHQSRSSSWLSIRHEDERGVTAILTGNIVTNVEFLAIADRLSGCERLRTLRFSETGISDTQLSMLRLAPSLESISFIRESHVTDKSLHTLAKYPRLASLTFVDTGVTGVGFRALSASGDDEAKRCPLHTVTLIGSTVTEEGLETFADHANVSVAHIGAEQVGWQAVCSCLPRIRSLKILTLHSSMFTTEDMALLTDKMPWCIVSFHSRDFPGAKATSGLEDARRDSIWSDKRNAGSRPQK